ncbi:hypothetical protein [Mycobacteroides saopaulense]|uniref:Uncharacterized protein n=1 Tax=Mycobacteroides saopaulense TaxID=1578165 RepID=A0A1S1JFH8_9MYCO|nr:hypothetical protein [Mycobacteroides saopaulense]ALR10957.1 hypothetical protein MYCSP_05180 [Mycobacteroides saopaulense]OHT82362.1 hypothetical protein BKG68_20335 [Mycobacteroides saopaulense]OHU01746.1 hypothetical protein BKG73_23975 [Mycobacteroides saopaulense]ORB58925.1 hypothetical protein BST43_08895 [Mycobacteroides saopaulense]
MGGMQLPNSFEGLATDDGKSVVYGEPYTTADGTMVITVAKVRSRGRGPEGEPLETLARPLGVFVVKDGDAQWRPAFNADRASTLGILTGLLAAVLGLAAIIRRPPWPDLTLPGWSPAENPQWGRRGR